MHNRSNPGVFMRCKSVATLALAIAMGTVCASAGAQQFVDGSDGRTRQAAISGTEMTRIAFDGGRIRSIKYDETELLVSEDNAIGQLFVRPLVKSKTVSAFVITSTGTTHALELTPGATGMTSIIIQEPKRKEQKADVPPESSSPIGRSAGERLSAFDAGLRRLIGIMARDEQVVEFERIPKNRELALWQGTRFFLLNAWVGRGLRGESYRLINESAASIRMVEQEFYTPGVVAVSIEVHELPPGAGTNVFVVRREAAR